MAVVWIISALLVLYLFFVIAPAVCSFCVVFSRQEGKPFRGNDDDRLYFAKTFDQMRDSCAELDRLAWEEVSLRSADGLLLRGSYLDAHTARTAVLIHGYRATPYLNYAILAKELYQKGFNILLPYQRAHGKSEGKRTTLGILEGGDVLLWTEYAERERGAGEILLYGTSMGGASVAYASDRLGAYNVRAMVLDCAFSSPREQLMHDMKQRRLPRHLLYPWVHLCGKLLCKADFNRTSLDALKKTDIPALFVYGTADKTVPWETGRRNYEICASGRKQLLLTEGAGHTQALSERIVAGDGAFDAFLNTYFPEEEK